MMRAWRAACAQARTDRDARRVSRVAGRGLLGVGVAFAVLLLGAILGRVKGE